MTRPAPTGRVDGRSVWRAALLFSLCVTALGALVAGAAWLAWSADFALTFVYLRWSVVFAVLAAPLVWRSVLRQRGVRFPTPLRTPITALLLACESIVYDIVSAQIHRHW